MRILRRRSTHDGDTRALPNLQRTRPRECDRMRNVRQCAAHELDSGESAGSSPGWRRTALTMTVLVGPMIGPRRLADRDCDYRSQSLPRTCAMT
jgi:hypothetical protein